MECVENKKPKEDNSQAQENTESKNEDSEEQQAKKDHPCTPAIVRTRQTRKNFQVSSPSDAIMSPCTQRLFGRSRLKAGHGIHPGGLLKERQRSALSQLEQDKDLSKIPEFNCDS